MSLPVFLSGDLTGDRVELTGTEGRHAARVRRISVGERLELVDGRGLRATCTAVVVDNDRLVLDVLARRRDPPPSLRLVLVQALAKGDRGEAAVELATEVGVDEILPWAASRSVARWEGSRGARGHERWVATSRAATKQSRRSWLPTVAPLASTGQVAARISSATTLLLHQDAERLLRDSELPTAGELLLVVGPEGGIAQEELDLFEAAGAVAVRLGSPVLRTSTAGGVAAALVSARCGRW